MSAKPIATARVRVRDVDLVLFDGLTAPPSDDRNIALFKNERVIAAIENAIRPLEPKRIVELGLFEGGSAIYWEHRFNPSRMSLLDLRPEMTHLDRYIARHGLGDVMRTHLGVSQDDGPALRAAIGNDFEGAAIDLVIDDASHQHQETKASFETLFPFLRQDGAYVIEDWAWGHAGNWAPHQWRKRPLMSPLLSELMLICGKNEGVIDRLDIYPNFAVAWRGEATLPRDGTFLLAEHYISRGFPGL